MKKINKEIYILLSAIILGISLIASSYIFVSYNNSKDKKIENINTSTDVMTLEQTAAYMKMNKKDVLNIIKIEQERLNKYNGFSGEMFPYFKVDNNYYTYKEDLKEWLHDSCSDQREYDTNLNKMQK